MRLERGEVAVWTASLTGQGAPHWLSAEERARADAALDPRERRRRICARSVLRHVLGVYLGAPPAELALVIGVHGKPELSKGPPFNLSHSGDVMILAVAEAGAVGVDIDRLGRLDGDWSAVTARAFSAGERAQLQQMAEADRSVAALRGWVRKEAYAKARGAGFAYGFPGFTVRLDAGGDGALLVADDRDPQAVAAWSLQDLVAPAGFAASLACEGRPPILRHRAYEDLNSVNGSTPGAA
jgi:4'-phosphopantetheinyl transferase